MKSLQENNKGEVRKMPSILCIIISAHQHFPFVLVRIRSTEFKGKPLSFNENKCRSKEASTHQT